MIWHVQVTLLSYLVSSAAMEAWPLNLTDLNNISLEIRPSVLSIHGYQRRHAPPLIFRRPRIRNLRPVSCIPSGDRFRSRLALQPKSIVVLAAFSSKAPDQKQVRLLSLLMLSIFGAEGAFFSFQAVFLASRFTPTEVGYLTTMQKVLAVFVNPLVAGYADINKKHRLVMLTSALVQAILQVSLLIPTLGFYGVASVLVAHSLFKGHIFNIMDASAVATVGDRYGSVRLFGAIGYGIVAFLGGILAFCSGGASGQNSFLAPFALASCLQLISMPGLSNMNVKALSANVVEGGQRAQSSTVAFFRQVFSMRTALFYLITFCSGISSAIPDAWLNVYLKEQGGSAMLMGFGKLIACIAEVPFYHWSALLLRRIGITGCLIVSQAAYVCRCLWYVNLGPLADATSNMLGIPHDLALWVFFPSEILHGLTMSVFWSAVTRFAATIAPPGMQATSISVTNTMHFLLGFGTGATVLGALWDSIGGLNSLKVMAAFASATLGLCIVGLIAYGKQWEQVGKVITSNSSNATTI
eukprot:gnl/MRDRNA2_/MRDRNA2_167453_c0_seq1.p1 gnl/MRDRNA2_/MRDRNA2_167453_c0~~gnl/MRDRNA2_/MRDRNA2_167453_c0_seq1.p1  ORF type:complete len:525 (+),score=49.44 gnl/MRDRNA2_/MRDRNA2_167453_c0_seq1:131-1705(+)